MALQVGFAGYANAEVGVSYGADGSYGCFATGCAGVGYTAGISASLCGGYWQQDTVGDLSGLSEALVVEVGSVVSLSSVTTVAFPSFEIGQEVCLNGNIGFETLAPVSGGAQACYTEILYKE